MRLTNTEGLSFRIFSETEWNNSVGPMGDELITLHTSVRPIQTSRKFQSEINRKQKVGKCSLVRLKVQLGETKILGFRTTTI